MDFFQFKTTDLCEAVKGRLKQYTYLMDDYKIVYSGKQVKFFSFFNNIYLSLYKYG